ncbi:MAG: inositol phosphatase/fructose6-bisphosphatase [Rhodospirillales bacterium]|nr:inositol phosphatase/fructose6-bisphosphatase [Rhodospirillales bacterium]
MTQNSTTLERYLATFAHQEKDTGVAQIVSAIAAVSLTLRDLVAAGPLVGNLAAVRHEGSAGDPQKELDVRANELILEALASSPVAAVASEEMDEPAINDWHAPFAVAIDPIDGSSNIDTNAPIGTIFSVLPTVPHIEKDPCAPFLQSGPPLAAGFFVYGPQTVLVLTLGRGTQIFTHDRSSGQFIMTTRHAWIPPRTREYAINGSNYRHWDDAVRLYVNDCVDGTAGPRGMDFNTRWIASLVAEAFRIMIRGGIYLYPGDARPGYGRGRLRMVYEANPIAWIIEQAGGAATDGKRRILDLSPATLHERVPLVFGSIEEVELLARYHTHPDSHGVRSPLFGQRSLFRA